MYSYRIWHIWELGYKAPNNDPTKLFPLLVEESPNHVRNMDITSKEDNPIHIIDYPILRIPKRATLQLRVSNAPFFDLYRVFTYLAMETPKGTQYHNLKDEEQYAIVNHHRYQ